MKEYKDIITIEPGKRGGKPCIRSMRITVYDVLSYLASGMTIEEILNDFSYLLVDIVKYHQTSLHHLYLLNIF